jgi:HD-like signal output (HDOD) protein
MHQSTLSDELIARLPSPKGVAFALTKACRSEHVHLQEIADLVRTDPALCGRLLALANSAATGGRSVIAVDDAVSRIGVLGVSRMALAFSLMDQYASGACANFNYAGYWSQSLLMAAAAKQLGAPRKLGDAGELFTLGLLAQIGCLAMATAFPTAYSELIVRNLGRADCLAQESLLFGTTHLALSEALMTRWGIPLEDVLAFCHYEEPPSVKSGIYGVANDRAQLAATAWNVALVISQESTDAVFERPECFASLEWLELDRETLSGYLHDIEATRSLWLALISR